MASDDRDHVFLDELLDVFLEQLRDGKSIAIEEFAAHRPHLRVEIAQVLALASKICVQRPTATPTIGGYEVSHELGRGAMGCVYLARQLALDREVAVKVMPALLAFEARQRFHTEARALAQLRHPHVVQVYDVIESAEYCAYAMELVPGRSLARVLAFMRGNASATLDDVLDYLGATRAPRERQSLMVWFCQIGVKIARALGEVHRAGLLHRDVKPSNILIRNDGAPLLSDFGLVRDQGSVIHTQTGQFLGTPAYASPEQLRGSNEQVSMRSDVYSLGVTLYECMTLHLPFRGCSSAELLQSIEFGQHAPLRKLNPKLPRDLETIIATAMEVDPGRRYATADELGDDLERLLNLRPIMARPAGFITRGVKLARRNRRVLAVGLAAGFLVAVMAVLSGWWLYRAWKRDQWVESQLTQARLAVLTPRHAERTFISVRGGGPAEPEPFESTKLALALECYARALRLDPDRRDIAIERAVVVLAEDVAADRPPGARTLEILTRCTLTRVAASRWTALHQPPQYRIEELAHAQPEDQRALGLLAYLLGAADLCNTAWAGLDLSPDSRDPFVDGALGQLLLAQEKPDLAYPRLMRAADAFQTAGFLWVDLAHAATKTGDAGRALGFLAHANAVGDLDPWHTHVHVEADARAALGQAAAARLLYEWMYRHHQAPTCRSHYARFLEAQGEWRRAAEIDLELVAAQGTFYLPALERAAERWWRSLDMPHRISEVLQSCRGQGLVREILKKRQEATPGTYLPSSSGDGELSLDDLWFTREVMNMDANDLWRMGQANTERLARTSLWLDRFSARTSLRRAWPQAARVLRKAVEAGVFFAAMLTVRSPDAYAQATLLKQFDGDTATASMGTSDTLADVGDVNQDGYPDLAIGSYFDDSAASNAGKVRVYSGKDGSVLYTWTGGGADETFGTVAGAGDVNNDGYPDIIVGAPSNPSASVPEYVKIFSGQTGAMLCKLSEGTTDALYGYSVAGVGDADGDGFDDVIVAALFYASTSGKIFVYSGATCGQLFTRTGSPNDYYGHDVSGLGDVNSDGYADFLVGSHRIDFGGKTDNGTVEVLLGGLPGSIGALHCRVSGDASNDWLGVSVQGCGDVDGDGVPDFIAGASGQPNSGAIPGYARVFSGATCAAIDTFTGDSVGDYFGREVSGAGDVNHDGVPDLIVGASNDDNTGTDAGMARVFSGADGSILCTLNGRSASDFSGAGVSSVGDLNGDGWSEFLVGAPLADPGGKTDAGSAYLFTLRPCLAAWTNYGSGWPGTNGIPSFTASGNPVLCSTITLDLGNSLGATTSGAMFLGLSSASISTGLGGTLLVVPSWIFLLPVIPAGGLPLPGPIPCDFALCGLNLYLQALELDAGASKGVSFTPGLNLTLGGTAW